MSDLPAKGRYVMVGFDSDEAALTFLTHLHGLDEMDRELLVAKRAADKKVSLTKFKIRTAYLRDV